MTHDTKTNISYNSLWYRRFASLGIIGWRAAGAIKRYPCLCRTFASAMMIMQALRRVAPKTLVDSTTRGLCQGSILPRPPLPWTISSGYGCESFIPPVNSRSKRHYSGKSWKGYDGEEKEEDDNDDEWNDAWESAWIPDESSSGKAPWEREDSSCSSFSSPWPTPAHPPEEEKECRDATHSVHNINSKMEQMTTLMKRITQVEEKEEDQRSQTPTFHPDPQEGDQREMHQNQQQLLFKENHSEEYRVSKKTVTKDEDYRTTKHRVHAALWLNEIQKHQEESNASLGGNPANDDIDQLLDKCSQFFDYADHDLRLPDDPNFKVMPEGWEAVAKDKDGRPWEISQKEEDILLQEFERRMAFNKIQIANFVKSHIFSRRRPIDGWKYMIEELGPNSKKGRGLANKFTGSSDGPRRSFDDNEKGIVRREFVGNRQ